jgi:hypothetical protein
MSEPRADVELPDAVAGVMACTVDSTRSAMGGGKLVLDAPGTGSPMAERIIACPHSLYAPQLESNCKTLTIG